MKYLVAFTALALAAPAAASANSYAYATLSISNLGFTIAPPANSANTFSLFSDSAATFAGTGNSAQATSPIPGSADSPLISVGPTIVSAQNNFGQLLTGGPGSRGDALVTVTSATRTSQSVAESHVPSGTSQSANASSGNRISFGYNLRRGTVITVTFDATRMFNISTQAIGEVSTAMSALSATLTRGNTAATTLNGAVSGAYDLNATTSVVDGDKFTSNDNGSFTVTFAPITTGGNYTLTIGSRTTTDVLSSANFPIVTPAPAAVSLLGLGLVGIAALRRRAR